MTARTCLADILTALADQVRSGELAPWKVARLQAAVKRQVEFYAVADALGGHVCPHCDTACIDLNELLEHARTAHPAAVAGMGRRG